MSTIDLITPFYNRTEYVEEFLETYDLTLKNTGKEYRIIIVDDSPNDDTYEKLKRLKYKFPSLTIIKLSKNWGQHNAMAQ